MELPYRFPNEAEVIRRDAEAFRRLSSRERFLRLLDLIGSGVKLLEHSPQREAGRKLRLLQEAEWQRIQKELFARHGT